MTQSFLTADFADGRRFPSRGFSIPGGPRSPEAVSRTNPGRMRFVPNADSRDLVPPAFSSPPVPGGPSSDEAAFANVNRNHLDEAENRPLNSPPPRAPRLRVNRNFRFSILDFPFPILPSADSWLLNPYLLVPLNRGDKSAFLEIVRR